MAKRIISLLSVILTVFVITTCAVSGAPAYGENTSALGLGTPLTSETAISYPVNDQGTLLNFGHEPERVFR